MSTDTNSNDGVGPVGIDFIDALEDVSPESFVQTAKPQAAPEAVKRAAEQAGFHSRPVVKASEKQPPKDSDILAKSIKRRNPNAITRERVALRADPSIFEDLKKIAAEQDPPWTVGQAFEQAVRALKRELV